VCPLSNIKLRVFDAMDDHNLIKLLDAGLVATVNSDDPAYFGGYMNANFLAVAEALPLDAKHAKQLARNSFKAAFLDPESRRRYLDEVDQYFSSIH
jgi:adenosine deaminase